MRDNLRKLLNKYRYKKFLVIEQGGNHGDKLIYIGMEKLLNELGIIYSKIHLSERYALIYKILLKIGIQINELTKNFEHILKKIDHKLYTKLNYKTLKNGNEYEIVLINGGSNINELYYYGLRLLKDVVKKYQDIPIIIAPQTYWFNKINFPKFFKNTKNAVHIFCREKYSYQLLKSMEFPKNVRLHLSHDTSLYLSRDDFNPRLGSYNLLCLRTDKESAINYNSNNLKQISGKILIEDISRNKKFEVFLDKIEMARKIYTDRLHVAILSTILGKDTTLFPNCYYKNKGVYEYSLSKYPNIKLIENLNIKNLTDVLEHS